MGRLMRARRSYLAAMLLLASTGTLLPIDSWTQTDESAPRAPAKDGSVPVASEQVYKVADGVSAPRAVYAPNPEYSEEARELDLQGTVVLSLVIGSDGRPRDIRVARALGMGLDEKAIEAVRTWRFEPAQKDGQPVAVQMSVETTFRMYSAEVPLTLEPLATEAAEARYPLMADVRFVTGQRTDTGYVVSAEATIHEGGQEHKVTIHCGPGHTCPLLRSGRYQARWLGASVMELTGREEGGEKRHKVRFSAVPAQAPGN